MSAMKKLFLISTSLLLIILILIGAYALSQNTSQSTTQEPQGEQSAQPTGAMMRKETVEADEVASSRYIEYANGVLGNTDTTRRVLFFYASWCPTCRPADDTFRQEMSRIPEDVTVIRVNYNDPETDQEEKDLAKKYGITYQHTFVQIDSTGKEVTKWNGGQLTELLAKIQ